MLRKHKASVVFAPMLLVLSVAVGLRWHLVAQAVRFHPDEALFATFARNAAVHGKWRLDGDLDKSPLSMYAAALSMQFTAVYVNDDGVLDMPLQLGEFAARLPNALAGVVCVALVYALGRRMYGAEAGLIAAVLAAYSPQLIAFSATAFTDMLMLMWMIAALTAAAYQRPLWAGVWLAVSFWSKQQGVFYLPLVLISMNYQYRYCGDAKNAQEVSSRIFHLPRRTLHVSMLVRFTLSFGLGLALLLLWDAVRGTTSLFAIAAANNTPQRFWVHPDALLPRLETWLGYASTFFGAWWVTAGLVGLAFINIMLLQRLTETEAKAIRLHKTKSTQVDSNHYLVQTTRVGFSRLATLAVDFNLRRKRQKPTVILLFYIIGYFLAHWLIAFNTYDRYLLPIVPLVAILVGYGITAGGKNAVPIFPLRSLRLGGSLMLMLVILLMTLSTPPRYPTDTRARDTAILDLAAYLKAKPLGAIIYDHWLGWEMGYYLGAWHDKRRVYYPEPQILAEDALLNPDPAPRYFIAPREQDVTAWLDALRTHGFAVRLDWQNPRYVVYVLMPPPTLGISPSAAQAP